jgi:hypothetical protein
VKLDDLSKKAILWNCGTDVEHEIKIKDAIIYKVLKSELECLIFDHSKKLFRKFTLDTPPFLPLVTLLTLDSLDSLDANPLLTLLHNNKRTKKKTSFTRHH